MSHNGWSDDELAAGLRHRDSRVLEEMITRFSREIFYFMRMILANVGTIQDVEECVSDLFYSVWQEHDAYDPARASFRTWLTMRAKYLALDRRRLLLRGQGSTQIVLVSEVEAEQTDGTGDLAGRVGRQHLQMLGIEESIEAVVERREDQARLYEALARLPESDRHLVYLRYFRFMSTDDIASQTGLSRHAIDTRLWRARGRLKEALQEPIYGRVFP
jgi:RNA polymerase sigma factor (sigma-70 family)